MRLTYLSATSDPRPLYQHTPTLIGCGRQYIRYTVGNNNVKVF